jgi:hypothetical protein
MSVKTLVTVMIVVGTVLLPIGGWTLTTVATSASRISVLEEQTRTLTQMNMRIEDKLDQILKEQAKVAAALSLKTTRETGGMP